jgi:hypothetical protein
MADMFAKDHICEPAEARLLYDKLSVAFREDLYVTDLTRPLPRLVPKQEGAPAPGNPLESTADPARRQGFRGSAAIMAPPPKQMIHTACLPHSGRSAQRRGKSSRAGKASVDPDDQESVASPRYGRVTSGARSACSTAGQARTAST